MNSSTDITLRRVLVGHRAAVNVVDFDAKYIVSASGDRTIKVWSTATCEFVRTLNGHRRGIACLQYRDRLVVSGSSDNTVRSVEFMLKFIHSFIPSISIVPFQVHYYSEALPTQHGFCVGVSRKRATGNCELGTCPRSLHGG